jgi:hypothetical protein
MIGLTCARRDFHFDSLQPRYNALRPALEVCSTIAASDPGAPEPYRKAGKLDSSLLFSKACIGTFS